MCHSGQTKAQERKASQAWCAVRESWGEEVVMNVERTVSPGEVQAFAMETNKGFDVGSTVQQLGPSCTSKHALGSLGVIRNSLKFH